MRPREHQQCGRSWAPGPWRGLGERGSWREGPAASLQLGGARGARVHAYTHVWCVHGRARTGMALKPSPAFLQPPEGVGFPSGFCA